MQDTHILTNYNMNNEQEYLEVLNKLDEHDQEIIINHIQSLKREIFGLKAKCKHLSLRYEKICKYGKWEN